MSDRKSYRTLDEWFALIQECRKSGMTDAQWCLANGISRHTLNKAITCVLRTPAVGDAVVNGRTAVTNGRP